MTERTRDWTRREWLGLMAAGTVSGAALLQGQGPRRLGVQLYTVRDQLPKDAAGTLKAIAAIGYKEIELGRNDLGKLVPLAREVGLTAVSTHIESSLVTGIPMPPPGGAAAGAPAPAPATTPLADRQKKAFEEIRKHGATYAVLAYIFQSERKNEVAYWQRLAEQLTQAGKIAKAAGVTLGYHNHGFEFESLPDKRRPLDVLLAESDPALVKVELDVFWVGITGADPVALIKQLGSRVSLLHLKDKAKDAPVETNEGKVAKGAFVEVGSGALDFPAILAAAKTAGVAHFFVEQDQTPGDPIASLKKSYEYLSKLS
jgi:sugar phosphate isomerase/epimerase